MNRKNKSKEDMSSNCQTAGVCSKYVNLMNDVALSST